MLKPTISQPLAPIVAKVISAGSCEATLREICEYYGQQDPDLGIVEKAIADLAQFELRMIPSPEQSGNFDTVRLIEHKTTRDLSVDEALNEIQKSESVDLEFKSSLYYDFKRAENDKRATLADLKSEEVVHSSLKTICGFLNASGGYLYIGISDDRKPRGIIHDCNLLGCADLDVDAWELFLRNKIRTSFKDGSTINNYLTIRFIEISNTVVARIVVRGRRELSYVKKGNRYEFYSRQGNTTVEYQIDQMQEYLEDRFGTRQFDPTKTS